MGIWIVGKSKNLRTYNNLKVKNFNIQKLLCKNPFFYYFFVLPPNREKREEAALEGGGW